MDEDNIQRQFEAPYLISNSPGEVSRYLNKLCDLEIIDKLSKKLTAFLNKTKQ
jgi:hypothetical protein